MHIIRAKEWTLVERKHSKIGVASFIIAIVAILGMIATIVATTTMAASIAGGSPASAPGELPAANVGGFLAMAGLMFLCLVAALVGAVLGLVGLFQQHRLKLFSVLGIAFNSGLVLVFFVLLFAGIIWGPALPNADPAG